MKPTPQASSEQEFRYGWRYVKRTLADGGVEFDQVPLTLEDVLYPQEGDHVMNNTDHDADCRYLAGVFESRPLSPPFAFVSHDMGVTWGVSGIGNHSPDLAVFVSLKADPRPTGLLRLKEYGGRCALIVEVVSPDTRVNDVKTKFEQYLQIGIPLYVIIDQPREGGPRALIAYRIEKGRYERVEPDEQGRIAVPVLGLTIGMRDEHPVCYDLRNGEELGDYRSVVRRLEEADRRAEQQEQAIEEQILARKDVQRLAADAQKEAEKQKREAEKERRERETLADEKRRAEDTATQRIRDLEELVRRLQSAGPAD